MSLVGLLINPMPWVMLINIHVSLLFPDQNWEIEGNVYVKSETKRYSIVSRIDDWKCLQLKLNWI